MLRLLIVVAPLILAPPPAAAERPAGPETTMSESAKANAFFEEAFVELLMRQPQFQSRLGMKTNYDRWDDISEAHELQTLEIRKRQLETLRATIERDRLDAQTRLSYDLFAYEAEREIGDFEFRHHNYPVNQMFGLQSAVPTFLINYHRIDTVEDANAYLARLTNVKPLFDDLIAGIRSRADKGVIPPQFVFPYVLSDARNVITGAPFDDGNDSTILADFRRKLSALDMSDGDREVLIERAKNVLLESVLPAYETLIGYVAKLQERATTDDGAWKLPNGAAYYKRRLRNITTTDLSPDAIHTIGLTEVVRIHDEMLGIMGRVGFEGSQKDFFAFMRDDRRFYYPDSDEGRTAYLTRATDIINTMRGRLDELFITKPRADIIVKRVEAFREKSAGKAFYQRPAPDGSRPGIYYANLYKMSLMPTYQMEALAYHEGIPGHHMQLSIAVELDDIPKFRRYGQYTAHTEGWGLYCEYVPKEMGFYDDPYSDFGRLAMELWRACRLVVDTGIHDKRWTREEAIDYLVENTPNPRGDAVKAIERYIVMPGQATAYKIGMMKILELRESARARLGDRFDIREFHDVILRNGPVPLSVLEGLVDEWVLSREARPEGSR